MPVSKDKLLELKQRMERLGVKEEDLQEKFILGSGSGGQKVNKTASCVHIKHLPTGTQVKCQRERSRALNRFFARRMLCEKIEVKIHKIKTEKKKLAEKIRRQKKRRTRRQKEKILKDKRHQSEKKTLRQPPQSEE